MRRRLVLGILGSGLVLALLGMPGASFAAGSLAPRLLTNFGDSFRVRPAMAVFGMVAITGPHVTADGVSRRSLRSHRLGGVVIRRGARVWPGVGSQVRAALLDDGPRWRVRDGRVEWTFGAGSHPYTEWDDLLRFGQSHDWRVVRWTGGP
jgi:hypothetical protein